MSRRLGMAALALLTGCASTEQIPRDAPEASVPVLPEPAAAPAPSLPPFGVPPEPPDCDEAERKAHEIALLVTVIHDLDALNAAMRREVARVRQVEEVDLTGFPLDGQWTYRGNGSAWRFTSGAWSMTMDDEGLGTIHVACSDPDHEASAQVEARRVKGNYRFGSWHAEHWIILNIPFCGNDELVFVPTCDFEIPVATGSAP